MHAFLSPGSWGHGMRAHPAADGQRNTRITLISQYSDATTPTSIPAPKSPVSAPTNPANTTRRA